MSADLVPTVHTLVERPSWAPWLRFSEEEMRSLVEVFPDGQLVELDVDQRPVAALSSVRIAWDGDPARLGSWDEVAGRTSSIGDAHDPHGSTLVMLSVSVRPDRIGEGLASLLIDRARALARDRDLEHVISPFRPSGFGAAKLAGGGASFFEHCAATRPDGLPVDPWLRVLRRKGMHPLKVAPAAMVVTATASEVARWRAETPEGWRRVDASSAFGEGIGRPAGEEVEVWECGETGTWYVDVGDDRATYIEDNLWGEVPIDHPAVARPWVIVDGERRTDAVSSNDAVGPDEEHLVAEIRAVAPEEQGVAVWIDPSHPAAEVIRELEVGVFPDLAAFLTPAVEQRCRLLAVVDLRGDGHVMHCFRVSARHYGPAEIEPGSSGIPMIDEVLAENTDLTLDRVVDHYRGRGVDLGRCLAVETSLRVRAGKAPNGLRWSDLGYLAVFQEVMEGTDGDGSHGVFGHMNAATLRSLAAIGVEVEPFCGDPSLRSPVSHVGTVIDASAPSFIAETDEVVEIFGALASLSPPAVRLEPVIDLRDSATQPLVLEEVPVEADPD